LETGVGQPFGKGRVRASGPEEGASVWFEHSGHSLEALGTVEPGVQLLNHGAGAIIDVEHQGVVTSRRRARDDRPHIAQQHFNPWIVQQRSVQVAQEIAIPIDDLRDELCDLDLRSGTALGEQALQRKAESQPAQQRKRIRLARERLSRQFSEPELRRRD